MKSGPEGFGGGGGRGGGGRGGGYRRGGIHRGGGWWGRGGGYNYLPFYYGYEYPSYVVTDYDPYYYQYFKNLRWF